MSRPTLVDLFAATAGTTDKNSLHSYGEVYDDLLAPLRDRALTVLEVGVRDGSSLKVWRDYFPEAVIIGVDNGSEAGHWNSDWENRIHVFEADSTKPETLREIIDQSAPFDLIIDDGCHHPYVQMATWAALWPYVRPGGLYITEDVEDISYARTMAQHFGGEVIDRREIKQRHDDILVVWRKPSA